MSDYKVGDHLLVKLTSGRIVERRPWKPSSIRQMVCACKFH